MSRLIPKFIIVALFIFSTLISGLLSAENINSLAIDNYAINTPLEGLTGNSDNGRKLVVDKDKGNCLACHLLPIPEEDFHGTIGPSLIDIASRLNSAQLRLRITDMKQINPFSIMPGYFREASQINRIAAQYETTTILTAQEIEDIVAYLTTLKSHQLGSNP